MRSFNLALLGKQAWRLVDNPSSLLARVLKARYYPQTSFSMASLGRNPSFTWRSILAAQDLVNNGTKWELANGTNINVWNHRWVNHTHSNIVITPMNPDYKSLTVADLIDEHIGTWKIQLVNSLFYRIDSEAILDMPLRRLHATDSPRWSLEKHGKYSVKSAYSFLRNNQSSNNIQASSSSQEQTAFNQIWSLKIPNKVKLFLFKACHDKLPTKVNLRKRTVDLCTTCLFCKQSEETGIHLFQDCIFNTEVQRQLKFPDLQLTHAFFKDLFLDLKEKLPPDKFKLWVICIRNLWHQRNKLLWENHCQTPPQVVQFSLSFKEANEKAPSLLLSLKPPRT